jgi:hypothetical protein
MYKAVLASLLVLAQLMRLHWLVVLQAAPAVVRTAGLWTFNT